MPSATPAADAIAGFAADFAAGIPTTCQYSGAHKLSGVAATQTIECGPLGTVPVCDDCAAFYRSMGGEDE